ncbi:MAG: histidine kinase [Lachnospiraceae bacterium]|nr:histidine kinase [Lachnospiraceae bacterium]
MKQKKNRSMEKYAVRILTFAIAFFIVILAVMFLNMLEARRLVYKYIEDTARLYVEQINESIVKINYEVITLLKKNEKEYLNLQDLRPDQAKNYPSMDAVSEQLQNLKARYTESECFYLYLSDEDVMILGGGTVFPSSRVEGRSLALRNLLREKRGIGTQYPEWEFFSDGEKDYIYSRYCQSGISMGCVIRLEKLFSDLHVDSLGYEGIPYMSDESGNVLITADDSDKVVVDDAGNVRGNKKDIFSERKLYKFPIRGLSRDIFILVTPASGSLYNMIILQVLLLIFLIIIIPVGIYLFRAYQNRILQPMRQFVNSLKNTEEEQWLSENGKNNLLELELASEEFRRLLRKIRQLKIGIYEKELEQQKTMLEAMQMQIRPHFYLNCLSIIHGMADLGKTEEIIAVTENLSTYMRHVMKDIYEKEPLGQDVAFVSSYVQIQQIRYGRESFSFEVIMDDGLRDYLVPVLLIHNFVENAIVHAVSLDEHVEISLYVVTEKYKDGEYLYICISDTGKGFPEEILKSIKEDKPIYYDEREHIGISNSIKRLELMYGEKAGINLSNMDDGFGAVVEIRIPAEKIEEEVGSKGDNR